MANILIVDDSKTSRKMLRNILESEGHVIVGEAVNGQEGVQQFQALKPDLVTLDITMPVVDGIEALKMIRAFSRDVKIIMVTAAGQKNKMIECIKEGADDFLTKPYEPHEIIAVVTKLFS
jgi:two-component system chemotaxis response regulator CheY